MPLRSSDRLAVHPLPNRIGSKLAADHYAQRDGNDNNVVPVCPEANPPTVSDRLELSRTIQEGVDAAFVLCGCSDRCPRVPPVPRVPA